MFQKFMRIFSKNPNREQTILRRISTILEFQRKDEFRILDDGTGRGVIARGLSDRGTIIGIDQASEFAKKRKRMGNPQFLRAVGEFLPFKPNSFDVIISQMVLEHVFWVKKYLEEIYRVIELKGILYLAFPNRGFPIEPHTKIPIIPYLPHKLFQKIVDAKIGRKYPLNYLSYKTLKVISGVGFNKVRDLVQIFLKNQYRFYPAVPPFICRLLVKIYWIARFFIPTWIWLLEKTWNIKWS